MSRQGHVLRGGTAFLLQGLLVLAWAVALIPLLLWRGVRGSR